MGAMAIMLAALRTSCRVPVLRLSWKIERFHGSLRRELLDHAIPFADLAVGQAAIDRWREEYNTSRRCGVS
jgi:transposase InsO family protein